MIEKTFHLESIDPATLYGSQNRFLKIIQQHFKELKITARGNDLKVNGDEKAINRFIEKLEEIVAHLNRYNGLTVNQLERILDNEMEKAPEDPSSDVIVHGSSGAPIKARTQNQRKMVEAIVKNDMLFAIGPAGTGKTYTAVALAVKALKDREVKRIILTRPAVEAGENLGFLPGDLKEKLDPYMQPLYDALRDMIPAEKLVNYIENGVIQIAPLAFMRGRTLDRAFVILDEAQNTTHSQMKMFLTRMGMDAKFIITGDSGQIDLPRNQRSGLVEAERILGRVKGISFIKLNEKDVIRHQLVKSIIGAYDKQEKHESTTGNRP